MPDANLVVPPILSLTTTADDFPIDAAELAYVVRAGGLFQAGYPSHALLDLWNAAVCNLRRRVEAYSASLFLTVVKQEAGRKSYNPDGDSLSERWEGVDEIVLLTGAKRLGLLSGKAYKCLETVNWMRNHVSPAHPVDEQVSPADVVALAIILQENLFRQPLPDPGHSVAALFAPVKRAPLTSDQSDQLRDQILSYSPRDLRTCFGFLLEQIVNGDEPAHFNARMLMPHAWTNAGEDLRNVVGETYFSYTLDPTSDPSTDQAAASRLLDFLVSQAGFRYIPESGRIGLFRRAARQLAIAKNTPYGWADENAQARTLAQFGHPVPRLAAEEVYQEILAVYCGNYWGRSAAHSILQSFLDTLDTTGIRLVATLFASNSRVQSELGNSKPKLHAVSLLRQLRPRLTIASHQGEVDHAITIVQEL